jgi:hypothetical protein
MNKNISFCKTKARAVYSFPFLSFPFVMKTKKSLFAWILNEEDETETNIYARQSESEC